MPVDLRSDTVTWPTDEMRKAMASAPVGDDVYEEDPTVNKLEELTAQKLGKEAALFVASGTMGNLISLLVHTHHLRGSEIIAEASSHIFINEVGGGAALGGIQIRPVKGNKGVMNPADIKAAIRSENIHYPETSLICVENTHNSAGGVPQPLENLAAIRQIADEAGIPVHFDGARLYNAAVAQGVDIKEITQYADSINLCLSKGLCAPVGSMICGSRAFIALARRYRKMVGGGMRQAGVLAAAGIIAIEEMSKRLGEDHENARMLAEGLSKLEGIEIDLDTVQTNIIRFNMAEGYSAIDFGEKMEERGFLFAPSEPGRGRLVTHKYITWKDVEAFLQAAALCF